MKKENIMSTRKLAVALGFAVAVGAPLAAVASHTQQTTMDGFEYHLVTPASAAASKSAMPIDTKPLKAGDISADRLYVFSDGDGGWQLRVMEYRFQGGRLVMVDDPAGHMTRNADTSPMTAQQRASYNSSRGN
jgi:hypothetical protein